MTMKNQLTAKDLGYLQKCLWMMEIVNAKTYIMLQPKGGTLQAVSQLDHDDSNGLSLRHPLY